MRKTMDLILNQPKVTPIYTTDQAISLFPDIPYGALGGFIPDTGAEKEIFDHFKRLYNAIYQRLRAFFIGRIDLLHKDELLREAEPSTKLALARKDLCEALMRRLAIYAKNPFPAQQWIIWEIKHLEGVFYMNGLIDHRVAVDEKGRPLGKSKFKKRKQHFLNNCINKLNEKELPDSRKVENPETEYSEMLLYEAWNLAYYQNDDYLWDKILSYFRCEYQVLDTVAENPDTTKNYMMSPALVNNKVIYHRQGKRKERLSKNQRR